MLSQRGPAGVAYPDMEIRTRRRLVLRVYPLGPHETAAHQPMQFLGGNASTHQCRQRGAFPSVGDQFQGFQLTTRQRHCRHIIPERTEVTTHLDRFRVAKVGRGRVVAAGCTVSDFPAPWACQRGEIQGGAGYGGSIRAYRGTGLDGVSVVASAAELALQNPQTPAHDHWPDLSRPRKVPPTGTCYFVPVSFSGGETDGFEGNTAGFETD
jgi:hypothetical protein